MWPSLSDMSRDECRKCLRCLELDAYGNMVSVLRAQGPLTEEKRKLLGELAKILHISNERHRAEVRRAVNDEKLSIIAEQLNSPTVCTDWAIEGRRTIPLLPRLKAHTAFTGLANSLSLVIAAANEKKFAASAKLEERTVKAERTSLELCVKDERATSELAATPPETKTTGRKRKRSSPGSSDNEKCRKAKSTETKARHTEANSISQVENRVASPRPVGDDETTKVVQVSIVTPSSTVDTTGRNNVNTPEASSTKVSNHRKFIVEPSIKRNHEGGESTANTLILEATDRQNITNDINGQQTIHEAECGLAKILQQEVSDSCVVTETTAALPGEDVILVEGLTEEETKVSRPDSTTSGTPCAKRLIASKFCVTTKPIITSSTNCTMAVNSGSTASCGPGPPTVTPAATSTYKKLPIGKLNHHTDTQMSVALNSSKTLKINAHPNARVASKANVIVVKKGSSRGVTLSHGGKEVLGKVIMGGKSLRLATQKSNTSAGALLLPHRGGSSNNGEQTLTTLTLSQAESLKLGAKAGNMLMLDIRQDVLDENAVLSQFLEASLASNPKEAGTTGLNNSDNDSNNYTYVGAKSHVTKKPESITLNGLSVELSENLETLNGDCSSLYSIVEHVDSSDANDNCDEILGAIKDDSIETHDARDPQTALYNYESADGIVIEDRIEESIEATGIDFFTTALDSPDINLESLRYVNDDEDEDDDEDRQILIETSNHTLEDSPFCEIIEQVDQLADS